VALLLLLPWVVMLSMSDSMSVSTSIDSGSALVTEPEANGLTPAEINIVDVNPHPAITPPPENSEIRTIGVVDEARDFDSINARISMIQDLPIAVPAKSKTEPDPVIESVAVVAQSKPARIGSYRTRCYRRDIGARQNRSAQAAALPTRNRETENRRNRDQASGDYPSRFGFETSGALPAAG
jgi:hypothetical protein